MEEYISTIGLTYEDHEWVNARKTDLEAYFKSRGVKQDVKEVMMSEMPRILKEYDDARQYSEGIKIIIEYKERALDESISHGYGHSKIGLFEGKVIKVVEVITPYQQAIVRVDLIKAVAKLCLFIKRAIDMQALVPDVVRLHPILLVTITKGKYMYSIMMERAPGRPLIQCGRIDKDVANRVVDTVVAMGSLGYGFSDFALDNVMYDKDTDKITVIDIKPTDFERTKRFISDSVGNISMQLYYSP